MFETIDSSQESPRKALAARLRYYDKEDQGRLDTHLNEFTMAYTRGAMCVRGKRADDLVAEMRQMIQPLQEAQTVLRSTLYDRILQTLQGLGR
jgi:hypothetical protein